MGKLITPSLLDSVAWFRNCPESWKKSAHDDLTKALTRAPWTPTPAIQRGIDFEKKVCALLDKPCAADFMEHFVGHTPSVIQFYERCRGGKQQVVLKKDVAIGGVTYTLYGRSDILFPKNECNEGRILDIKTTANWKGPSKYAKSSQHDVYAICSGILDFEYLVAEFSEVTERCMAVHSVPLTIDTDEATMRVTDAIKDAITLFQDDQDWWKAYNTQFNRF